MQQLLLFSINILLFIEILFYLTTPLNIINRDVFVNNINFTTKIKSGKSFP
jgi:hypothetical protein